MKGFIFAAGFGKRLRPITADMPKSLAPVCNLPSICFALHRLKQAGIEDIVCNLHYRHQDIIDYFDRHRSFGCSVQFSYEEEILGTGGGLKKCEKMLGDDDFVLINSDVISDINIAELVAHHKRSGAPATLVLYRTDKAEQIGEVGVRNNKIVDFNNLLGTGATSGCIYTGAALFSPKIFEYLLLEFSNIVHNGFVDLINNHFIAAFEHQGHWRDIGSLQSYWESNLACLSEVDRLQKEIYATLGVGPAHAGRADIGKTASISNSVIGEGARIGSGAVITNSVIMPGAVVDNGQVVSNSVLFGNRVIFTGERV